MSIPLRDDHSRICIDPCALEDPTAAQQRHQSDKGTALPCIQCARLSLLVSSPRPPNLRRHAGADGLGGCLIGIAHPGCVVAHGGSAVAVTEPAGYRAQVDSCGE